MNKSRKNKYFYSFSFLTDCDKNFSEREEDLFPTNVLLRDYPIKKRTL